MAGFPDVLKDGDIELRRMKPTFDFAEAVFGIIEKNRERLGRWLPWVHDAVTPEDEYDGLSYIHKKEHGFFIFADGKIVGSAGFVKIKEKERSLEIGYWIGEAALGHGIVTRSVRLLEKAAFGGKCGDWNLIRIRCDALNDRSAAVPKRLGYVFEGTIRQEYLYHDGSLGDLMSFSKLKSEWGRYA
jgi:ribosomal-protein-serine acetyltransferase